MRVVGSRVVLSIVTAKSSDWIKPMTCSASALDASGPRAKPKSSMYTMLADVRPVSRAKSAATALNLQKVPAEALKP